MDVSMDCPTLSSFPHNISSPAILGGPDERRKAAIKDVGTAVYQVPLQWFKDTILPPLPPDFNLQNAIQALKDNKTIKDDVWAAFSRPPSAQSAHEDKVFAPFATIAKNVGEEAMKQLGRDPAVVFECNPNRNPYSTLRENSSKPDGYGVYHGHDSYMADGHIFWEFIVAPGEKKKQARLEDINDNIAKILWSFNYIMCEDPCRRFVIGYTIEDTAMRLWFGSRSEILVSQWFNFVYGHESLVHFFVSQMYATHEQLGYDSTMRPAADPLAKRQNRFDITVHYTDDKGRNSSIEYRTVNPLSSIGAEAIKSRGTRVWDAQKIVPGGVEAEIVVIKDYWVDSDRIREAVVWDRIISAAKDDKQASLLNHLLTPLCSGDVITGSQPDSTFGVIRRAAELPSNAQVFPTVHTKPPKFAGLLVEDMPLGPKGTAAILRPIACTPEVPVGSNKHRHRIVFAEKGKTIETLTSVCNIFRAGAQTISALRALHLTGWLHRDISSGNILLVDGIVKLADLEYAKNMVDNSGHSERSGTAYFMALEVQSHRYRFFPVPENSDVPECDDFDSPDMKVVDESQPHSGDHTTTQPAIDDNSVVFKHNPLHDIESLWWVLVFLITTRKVNAAGVDERAFKIQYTHYEAMFIDQSARASALKENTFVVSRNYLHPSMHPAVAALEKARAAIVRTYVEAEKNVEGIDHTVGDALYRTLYSLFKKTSSLYNNSKDVNLEKIRSNTKDTPELPAASALAHPVTLDSDRVAPKRRWDHDLAGVEVDDELLRQEQENRKRAKKTSSEVDVAVDNVSGAASRPSGIQAE